MADRYWVLGSGNWNDTGHWSVASGGGSGASVPGASDSAIYDSLSGGGTCTFNVASVTVISLTTTTDNVTSFDLNGNTLTTTGALSWQKMTLTLGAGTINCAANLTIASTATLVANTGSLVMSGTVQQDLLVSTTAGTAYNLQISNTSADVRLAAHIRVTNNCTINSNATLRMNSALGAFNLYLRGSGNILTLTGKFRGDYSGNGGEVWFEMNTTNTTNIPGGTGFNINNSYSAASIRCTTIIGGVTGTFSIQGNIDNIDHLRTDTVSGGGMVFNTNNYSITVYAFMLYGPDAYADAGSGTFNFGSSSMTVTGPFCRFAHSGGTFNLSTSTWTISGAWSVYYVGTSAVNVEQTFNVGASTVYCRDIGESWFIGNPANAWFNIVRLNYPGNTIRVYSYTYANYMYQQDNGASTETNISCQRGIDVGTLTLTADYADAYFYFDEVDQSFVDTLTISGTGAYRVRLRSYVDATQAKLELLNNGTATRVDVKDNGLSGAQMDVTDATNINSGNNSGNWIWFYPQDMSFHSVGRGVRSGVAVGVS